MRARSVLQGGGPFKGKRITYPRQLLSWQRANDIYEAPRKVLEALDAELVEMKRCRSKGLCCGAGGAQMFKEEEKGTTHINIERAAEALETGSTVIASACPFCNTMLTDGVKNKEKEGNVQVVTLPNWWHNPCSRSFPYLCNMNWNFQSLITR